MAFAVAVSNVDKIDNISLVPDLSPDGEKPTFSSTS